MKRSSSTRRLSVVLGLAVTLSCISSPTSAAAAPDAELRAALSTSPVTTHVVAASGNNVLAFGNDLQLSNDGGQTWAQAAIEDADELWLDSVDAGKALITDYEQVVNVFDLAGNTNVEYWVPATEVGTVWGANSQTAVTAIWDEDWQGYFFSAVNLASGDITPLWDQWIPSNPSGFDSNDEAPMTVWVGEQGAALVTDYILDGKQTATDIDPLPLDGSYGGEAFRVTGYVPYVGVVGDRVEYLKRVSTSVSLCSVPLDGSAAGTCTKLATLGSSTHSVWADRSGDVIRLELNGVEYLWEDGLLKKVAVTGSTVVWEGAGDPTRPLLRAQSGTTGAIHRALAGGATEELFDDFRTPLQPYPLDLTAGRVVGLDQRGLAWTRPVTADSIGAESTLPGAIDWVAATAGRTVTGGQGTVTFHDRGVKKSATAVTGTLGDASGPYALVMSRGTGTLRTSTGAVAATNPQAIFGTRYVGVAVSGSGVKYPQVRDAANDQFSVDLNTAGFDTGVWRPSQTRIWGDWVTVDIDTGDSADTHVYHLAGPTPGWDLAYTDGSVVSMGDGVAVVLDHNTDRYVLWNYVTDERTELVEDAWAPVVDDADHLAYADDDELVVTTVPGMGASAPRLLGTVAPASFNPNAGPWKPEFDATKPLAAGTLEIGRVGEEPVRVLTVPASADGSVRGVDWDGRNETGEWVEDGTYTWTLTTTDAADLEKALVAIDGTSAVSGTVTVKAANLGTVAGSTPKVSDTTPTVDQTLTATTGAWNPASVKFAYQWYQGTTPIADATASTYLVKPADAGRTLKVKVTGSCPGTESYCRGYASTSKTSAATSTVAKAKITPAPVPTLLDASVPVVEKPITATIGSWGPEPVTLAYQWYKVSSGGTVSAISGAKASSFAPTGAEVGYRLKLKVTGSKAGYTTKSVYSALSGKVVKAAFVSVADPGITGSLKQGMTLTAVPGATDPAAKPGFQWYRGTAAGTTAISGATGSTYKTTSSDLGKQVKVKVTSTRSGYTSVVRYSTLTGVIEPGLSAVTPKLNDTTPVVGQVLSITDATGIGAWKPSEVTATYQWYRDSTAIPGATEATYEVQAADLAKAIKVKVTGSKDDYLSLAKTSAASTDVVKGTFTTKPAPTFEGLDGNSAKVGQELTAIKGDWAPTPDSFTYAWYRSGVLISGQTVATYTLTGADLAKTITVRVTAVRSGFTSASTTSAATLPILPA